MAKKWISILSIVSIIALFMFAFSLVGGSTAQGSDAVIQLQAGTINPASGKQPVTPPGLTVSGYAPNQRGYYIVQAVGPVQENWKTQVAAQGADLLDYLPDFAFKVRMNPAEAARVAALDDVAWVGIFQPAFKLSPKLDLAGPNLVRIRIEQGADTGATTAAVAQSGAQILSRDGSYLIVGADANQLKAIANVLDVAWIENYLPKEKHNEYGAGQIMGANIANTSGYDGSTQTVAVADTGLGDGTKSGAHPDIPAGRIVSIYNWPGVTDTCFQTITNDGAIDVESGHGTHVSGSILSDGGSGGEGKGTAPAAKLVFQATENWANISNYCQILGGWPSSGYFLTGLPDDLSTLFQQAYNDGARVHANSWGSAQAGVYTLDSANTDGFIWNHPDMTITFSAGNEGVDANNNGVVDVDSIGSPATAKNVITIGASENNRRGHYECDNSLTYTSHDAYQPGVNCTGMGGQNILGTAGTRWGFTAEPLKSDVTAGNEEQMAPFSSRGPTDDGRYKPDVVAPGTWILSGFSGLYQEGYGDPLNPKNNEYQYDGWGMPFNSTYKYMGGTSMANPLAAGAAAVVRDFYNKQYSGLDASAALVKATLINSAVDLLDENNDGVNDNDFPIPNEHEGWGRINLANATDNSAQFLDVSPGITSGGSTPTNFEVVTAGSALKITLVWSDFASTEAAAKNLVNDLDLVVTSPTGTTYRGNVFTGGWSQTGGNADRTNNVENVYVQSAANGIWTVTVTGFNVPNGPQPFALVVDGDLGAPPPPPTPEPTVVMHVGDLDGSTTPGSRNTWNAHVTITVLDANNNPVSNANVAGSWSSGASGSASCTTGSSGQCTVDKNNLKGSVSSVTFTVTTVSHPTNTYNSAANGDPDSDSNGTTIIVYQNGAPQPTPTPLPTATPGSGGTMHIGDLDGISTTGSRGRWNAFVTVIVHNVSHAPVPGVTVDGIWGGGASGSGSCVTTSSGECTISINNIKSNASTVSLTVNNLTLTGSTYTSGANHDPDGDSNGTTITVNQP